MDHEPGVQEHCASKADALEAINAVPDTFRELNKTTFGNIFYRKRRLVKRIDGIRKALSRRINPGLLLIETDLIREYNTTLRQEEIFLYQKSRVNWLRFGDRNTKFFHVSTLFRHRRNKIRALLINDV